MPLWKVKHVHAFIRWLLPLDLEGARYVVHFRRHGRFTSCNSSYMYNETELQDSDTPWELEMRHLGKSRASRVDSDSTTNRRCHHCGHSHRGIQPKSSAQNSGGFHDCNVFTLLLFPSLCFQVQGPGQTELRYRVRADQPLNLLKSVYSQQLDVGADCLRSGQSAHCPVVSNKTIAQITLSWGGVGRFRHPLETQNGSWRSGSFLETRRCC